MTGAGKRRNALLISGLLLLVVWLIVTLGWVDPAQKYPELAESPDPAIAGTIAYVGENLDRESCLYTVPAAGGEPAELLCRDYFATFPVWTRQGRILVETWETEMDGFNGSTTYLIVEDRTSGDPQDGQPRDVSVTEINSKDMPRAARKALRKALEDRTPEVRKDGAKVVTRNDYEGTIKVVVRYKDGSRKTILEVDDASQRYAFVDAQWSPDGRWVLVSDSVGRLLIVGEDGEPGARVLVDERDGVLNADWYIKGKRIYAVRVPDAAK